MKVISVCGLSKSGKTTICETIIRGLRMRGYTVGSIKEIHSETFAMDPDPVANTNRHRAAGAQLVTARGIYETDVLYQSCLPVEDILKHYDHDFVIMEGVSDCNVPIIVSARSEYEVKERKDGRVIAVSGRIANEVSGEIVGLPIFNALTQSEELIDFVVGHAFEPLPSFDPDCCSACGYNCREMAGRIAQGLSQRTDCELDRQVVELRINGKAIKMVPFVQTILQNAVMGVVSALNGTAEHANIEVKFKV